MELPILRLRSAWPPMFGPELEGVESLMVCVKGVTVKQLLSSSMRVVCSLMDSGSSRSPEVVDHDICSRPCLVELAVALKVTADVCSRFGHYLLHAIVDNVSPKTAVPIRASVLWPAVIEGDKYRWNIFGSHSCVKCTILNRGCWLAYIQ